MCGLVGYATTDPDAKLKALFTELLLLSSFRGLHSTGVGAIDVFDGETDILKVVGNPFNLFETQAYNNLSSAFKNVWLGHTRHATRGNVTKWNAHPFEYGEIVGAHNGTLLNDYDLRKEITNKFGLETDSQILYAHIAEHGIRNTIPKVRGAWALTFFNREDNILYFHKNEERPLWYCFNEDKSCMWWASEWTMLNYILTDRNKIELFRDEEGFAFFPVEDDTLYGFRVPRDKSFKREKTPIVLEIEEDLKGAEKYVPMVSTPFSANGKKDEGTPKTRLLQLVEGTEGVTVKPPHVTPSNEKKESSSTESCMSRCLTESDSKGSRNPKPLLSLATTNKGDKLDDSLLYGPDGQLLFSDEFRKLTCDGCLWCSAEIKETDANYIRWVTSSPSKGAEETTHVLCPTCSQPDSEAMENARWITGAYGKITEPVVELAAQKLEGKSKTSKPKKAPKTPTKVESKPKVEPEVKEKKKLEKHNPQDALGLDTEPVMKKKVAAK